MPDALPTLLNARDPGPSEGPQVEEIPRPAFPQFTRRHTVGDAPKLGGAGSPPALGRHASVGVGPSGSAGSRVAILHADPPRNADTGWMP